MWNELPFFVVDDVVFILVLIRFCLLTKTLDNEHVAGCNWLCAPRCRDEAPQEQEWAPLTLTAQVHQDWRPMKYRRLWCKLHYVFVITWQSINQKRWLSITLFSHVKIIVYFSITKNTSNGLSSENSSSGSVDRPLSASLSGVVSLIQINQNGTDRNWKSVLKYDGK